MLFVGDQSTGSTVAERLGTEIDRISVLTAAGAMAGLDEFEATTVDCVISEFDLPDGDGTTLLRRIRERADDCPFVLYAEPEAIEPTVAFDAGVTEYVTQSEAHALDRLTHTVERALDHRRTATRLAEERDLTRRLRESGHGGVLTIDADGRITTASARAAEILGEREAAITGRTVTDSPWRVFDRDGTALTGSECPVVAAVEADEPVRSECTLERPTGERRHVSISAWPGIDHPGADGAVVSIRDVTDRVEHETELDRSRSRLRAMFDEAADPIFVADRAGAIVDASRQAVEVFGYDRDELLDMHAWELAVGTDRAQLIDLYEDLPVAESVTIDGRYRRADGTELPGEISLRRFSADGEQRIITQFRDVSERRRVRERLRASRQSLRTLYETISDGDLDFDAKVSEILRVGCERLDLPYGFLTLVDDGRQNVVAARGDHELLQPGESEPLDRSYCRKTLEGDGLLAVVDALDEGWTDDPAYDQYELGCYLGGAIEVDDEQYGTLCFADSEARTMPFSTAERTFVELLVQWITHELERRERAERLERHRTRFDRTQKLADIGAWEYNTATEAVNWTEQTRRIHGLPPGHDPTQEEILEFYHPDDREDIRSAYERAVCGDEAFDLDVRLVTPSDRQRWVRVQGEPRDEDGTIIQGTVQDVTDRYSRRRELRTYAEAVNTAGDPIYRLDREGRFRMVNDALVDRLGYDREEILGEHVSAVMVDDAAIAETREAIGRAVAEESAAVITEEFDLESADGEIVPIESRISVLFEDGQFHGTIGVSRDISDRKRYESSLQALNGATRELLGATAIDDVDRTVLEAVTDTLGLGEAIVFRKAGEVDGLEPVAWSDRMDPVIDGGPDIWDDSTPAWEALQREVVLTCDDTGKLDEALGERADSCSFVPLGQRGVLLVTGTGSRDGDGGVLELVETLAATAEAAFERVEHERELQSEKAFVNGLIDSLPDLMYAIDTDGNYIRWNDRLLEVTGYTEAELADVEPVDLIHPDDREGIAEAIVDVTEGGVRRIEARIETATGEAIPYEFTGAPVREDGEVVAVAGIGRDVTERREYERTLTTLHDTTEDLLRAGSNEEIATEIVGAAEEVLDFDGVAIWEFEGAENVLEPIAYTDRVVELVGEPPAFGPGDGIAWEVFVDGTARVYDDVRKDEDVYDESTPFRAEVYIPLADSGVLTAGQTTIGPVDDRTLDLLEILAANCEAAMQRQRREGQLRERDRKLTANNERLERVREINEGIRRVDHSLVGADTRQEIERSVCEHVTETDRVAFAWMGTIDHVDETLVPKSWAGADRGYLDAVDTGLDGSEPAVVAARERRPVVVDAVANNLRDATWRQAALSRDLLSVMAVPLEYDGVLYGVLAVYGTSPSAFDEMVQEVIQEFGGTVGHALNAVERKRALLAESHVELEFELPTGSTPLFALAEALDSRLSLDGALPKSDDHTLLYVTIADADEDAVRGTVADLVTVESVRSVDRSEDGSQFELELSGSSLPATVAEHGGSVESLSLSDGSGQVRITLPETATVRSFVDLFVDRYPEAELIARRRRTADAPIDGAGDSPLDDLTPRQTDALTAAYYSGFFEWPRESAGEDVADSLDVAPPTFQEHLRRAQAKLLTDLLGDGLP